MHTTRPYQLNLLKLSWPIFVEGITGGLVTFTDIWFLSRISDEVAASVGMVSAVLMFGYFVLPQFTSAGGSVAAQYLGAKKPEFALTTYVANVIVGVLLGGLFSLFLFLSAPNIGLWLGLQPLQNGYAEQYLGVIAFNFILIGARTSYGAILSANTLTQWNMVSAIVTNVLNVFFCYAFFTGLWVFPKLGIPGIALATVISYLVGFFVYFGLVHFRLKLSFRPSLWLSKIRAVILPIFKVGFPSVLEPFSWAIQNFVVSVIIIHLGLVAMEANTYVMRILFIDLTASWALTAGGQIIMSHHFGGKKLDAVHRTYMKVVTYATSFAFVTILVYLIFSDSLFSLFTHNPAVKSLGFWILMVCLFMEPIRSINVLGGIALKTVGDGRFSVIIGMIFMWGLIPLLLVASFWGWGLIGIWCCLLFDETVRASINLWRWLQGRWRTRSVIVHEDDKVNV